MADVVHLLRLALLGLIVVSLMGEARAAAEPTEKDGPSRPLPPSGGTRDAAIALARRGKTAEALSILERLARQTPNDAALAGDLVVVLTWAGRDQEAIRRFRALPRKARADYVVLAVAQAQRFEHHYASALSLYRDGIIRFPGDPRFRAGEIETLVDAGQAKAADVEVRRALTGSRESVDLLIAAAYAAEAAGRPVDALHYAQRALDVAPADREALRQKALAIDAMGAPDVALDLAAAHPGLLTAAETSRLMGDAAADLVRWDAVEPVAEPRRFAAADRAIAALDRLIARFSAAGPEAAGALRRARCDRIVAYFDRARMRDAVAEYESLARSGVAVPAYALQAAAGAYLALRQPETARDLYRRVVETEPRNVQARLGLFHALVETEEFDAAFQVVDATAATTSPWIPLKGSPDPVANPDKLAADVAAANARLYAGELAEADRRFSAMSARAPNNSELLADLAETYEARGWPRRSEGTLQIARAQGSPDAEIDIAEAQDDFDLQDWPEFEAATSDLAQRLPENSEVRRLQREADLRQRAELRLFAERVWTSPTNINGGNGLATGLQLFSPPFAEYWRAFVAWDVAHQRLPEGNYTGRTYGTGVEYAGPLFDASAEARATQDGTDHGGGKLALAWRGDDQWRLGAAGEIFSTDTPLRALKNGISADSATLTADWRESESRDAKAFLEQAPFSDGNERTNLGFVWRERLFTAPHLSLDGIGDLGTSRNTRGDAPYYNPRNDALGTAGLAARQILLRRYQFSWEHGVTLAAGPYWERDFATSFAWSARYEQSIETDGLRIASGLGFGRQTYDGVYQNAVTLDLHLAWKF
ncbi:MAG TPA: poly-beta-1,6 N-acetyl-D-glucosamine export porin PgaA [Stellaceae bacterium]|nr:poly-beta-1,6 N-acetyl-D-glucosamine export porin PgaA [Stellaceae bacterium]